MAGGSLGTLQIDVLANIANMVSDLGRAQLESQKAAREFQRHWQEASDNIHESLRSLAEFAGVALSANAFKEWIGGAIEASEKTEKLSQSLGISTQSLQVMGYAAGLTGSSMEEMGNAMAKLEKSAVEAAAGNTKLQAVFGSLGVSIKDANGHVKSAEQLMRETTAAFSKFENGADKTTGAMLLMGRGAAQNIPLINELGEHYDELAKSAKEAGVVLSDLDQKALVSTQESMNRIAEDSKGLANTFAVLLAPSIKSAADALHAWAISDDAKSKTQGLVDAFRALGDAIAFVWHILESGAQFVAASIASLQTFDEGIRTLAYDIGNYASQTQQNLSKMFHLDFSGAIESQREAAKTASQKILDDQKATAAGLKVIWTGAITDILGNFGKATGAAAQFSNVIAGSSTVSEKAAKKHLDLAGALGSVRTEVDKSRDALLSLEAIVDKLSAQAGGPYTKAVDDYAAGLVRLQQAAEKAAVEGADVNAVLALWQQGEDALGQTLDNTIDKIIEQSDAIGQIDTRFQEQLDSIKGVTQAQEIEKQYLQDLAIAQRAWNAMMGEAVPMTQEYTDRIHQLSEAHVLELDAAKKAVEIQKQWQQIAVSGFDAVGNSIAQFATGGIKTWKDFGKSLVGDAQQFIAAIIQQFLKLTVFNGIINSLFGLSGSSALPTMSAGSILGNIGAMFGGGGGAGIGAMFGGLSGGSTGVAGLAANFTGGTGSIFDPTKWVDAGKSLYSGFTQLFGGGSTPVGNPLSPDFVGPPSEAANAFGPPALGGQPLGYGGYGSALGQGLGVAGGIFAGYNEFQNAGGGLGGIAGGLAYGVGTYFAGAAVTSALAGGLSAGLAAIPVVGWIAIAAMLIDKFSGGKLFGTAWKPTGASTSTLDVTGAGANISNSIEETRQAALFGGKKTKWKDIAASAEQAQAASDFFNQLQSSVTTFATALGQTAAEVIGGSFKTETDKHGKQTTSDTVLGVTYNEDQQHFAERLQADSFVAVLDKMGIGATAFVAGVQGDADKLMAAVQDLANATAGAQADIKKGLDLWAGATVDQVINETIKLNDGSEKLADTYVRLQQETTGLHSIFDTMGTQIDKTGKDFVEFADSAAKAAGGIENLTKLAQQFAKDFYSTSELTANSIATLKGKVATEFAAIGEDPMESLAKFRQDFEAALPTMSPEDLAKWYQAGVDLATLNQAVQQAADNYSQFIAQFNTTAATLTPFEQALVNLGDSITANIKKANDLAVANGQAGASAQDIGKIIAASVQQGAALLQKLEQEAATLAGQLFGTPLDQLKQQLADAQARVDAAHAHAGYDLQDQALVKTLAAQIAQSEAQAKAQQDFLGAASLLGDLGQIGAITGQSLSDFADQFKIPLDKLAKMLGTDQAGLQADFNKQESLAQAALDTAGNTKYTNELLADILAQFQGNPLPFSVDELNAAQAGVQPSVGGKPGTHGYGLPPSGSAQPADLYMQHPAGTRDGGHGGIVATTYGASQPVTQAIDNNTDAVTHAIRDLGQQFERKFDDMNRRIDRYGLVRGRAERV